MNKQELKRLAQEQRIIQDAVGADIDWSDRRFAAFEPIHRQDAQGLSFAVASELLQLETEAYRTVYEELKGRSFVPIDTSVNPGAETYGYKILDHSGKADYANDMSDEVPLVGLSGRLVTGRQVRMWDGYVISKDMLLAAQFMGMPLDPELAVVARRALEEKLNSLILIGDNGINMPGGYNHPEVTVSALGVDFDNSATTGAEMVAALVAQANAVRTGSKDMWIPNAIRMPLSTYLQFNSKFFSVTNSSNWNAAAAFSAAYGQPVTIEPDTMLETAGAAGVKRIVVYRKDPRVAQTVISEDVNFTAPEYQKLRYLKIATLKSGGFKLRQPLSFRYADGA
ncbi:MAG: hypothetical protein RL701_7569 [Pseudomonadota bacterium]